MNKSTQKRRSAYKRGFWAEYLAALALLLKGYRIVALRYKTKLGEIDIIARKGDMAAMIEVKARPSVSEAANAVTGNAQRRITNASDLWLANQRDAEQLSIRYDIVAVCPWQWPVHLEDAF